MSDFKNRLQRIENQLQQAADAYHQPKPLLLAVSKKHSAEAIEALFHAGQPAFGESYVQEALIKQEALSHLPLEWHFIGPIQSNKTKEIANHFTWVHSIDRLKIARRLNHQLEPGKPPLNVCVQINIDNEPSKAGIHPNDALAFFNALSDMPNLKPRGLMCIPKKREDFAEQRQPFKKMAALFRDLKDSGFNDLDTLSMGMSNDFAAAIAEGATIVRLGTALFGERI